jgi:hypothetical protein
MASETLRAIFALAGSVIGLAVLAIILSQRSETSSVLSSAGNALSAVIGAAASPVSGANVATTSNVANANPFGVNQPGATF